MADLPEALKHLAIRLEQLGWVSDLFVAGSLAMGDYQPGISDLDLVALVVGPVDRPRQAVLTTLHAELDTALGTGVNLGCAYVDQARILDRSARHPTWTHGHLLHRAFSGITRVELIRHGLAVFGRNPVRVLPPMSDDDVREAAREEVCGYWRSAVRRPWWWLDPTIAELGLTSMARARHTITTGELLIKTTAIEQTQAPEWLIDALRARRHGDDVRLPRVRTAMIAWHDARRTVSMLRC